MERRWINEGKQEGNLKEKLLQVRKFGESTRKIEHPDYKNQK